jgi:putative signal transducing protein
MMAETTMRNPHSGETGPDLVTIRTFVNEFEANLAKSALQAAGIDCMISRDDCGGMEPPLSMVKLVVRADDAGRAVEVLGHEAQDSN